MKFKLLYHGQLRASTTSDTRVKEKHLIRKEFHKQLKELWRVQAPFSSWLGAAKVPAQNSPSGKETTVIDIMADKHARCGYRFLPTISIGRSLSCGLDVTFLRRDHPGNLVRSGGDIDNRIKTLFDALRMPNNSGELANMPPGPDENPFYVLLEDDSQITKVSIATDRLLTAPADGEHINDVHLVIGVTVNVINVFGQFGNISFLGS